MIGAQGVGRNTKSKRTAELLHPSTQSGVQGQGGAREAQRAQELFLFVLRFSRIMLERGTRRNA